MNQIVSDERQPAVQGVLRRAVVDLGSNSVRLVVYEGEARNPLQIFNEKALLRLARGMTRTGRLDPEAMALRSRAAGRRRISTSTPLT